MRLGDRREARLRRFAEGLRAERLQPVDQRRIEQRGEMLVERMDLRPRGLGAGRAGPGLGGFGHGANMGAKRRGGKAAARIARRAGRRRGAALRRCGAAQPIR